MTVATALAGVDPLAPPPDDAGSTVTRTSAGAIVPDGKFDPVTLMLWIPGCPALGDAIELSVTLDCARTDSEAPIAKITVISRRSRGVNLFSLGSADSWR